MSASSSTAMRARSPTRTTCAPGWDLWSTLVGNGRGYYDFQLTVEGRQRKETYSGAEYLTDVLNDRAVEYARELAGADPFFLQVGQFAPHVENLNANGGGPCGGLAVPPRRDEGRFASEPLSRLPAVREADVSDKPQIVSGQPPIGPAKRRVLEHRYQCRLETLPAVDRGIAELVSTLRETGELDETVFVYASDNGTFHGQHRLPGGKGVAYEEAAKVPLVIRAPEPLLGDEPPVGRVDALTANIDLVPTLVEWAGTETCPEVGDCRVMDGRSLIPLLEGRDSEWPAKRPILTEIDIGKDQLQPGRGIPCGYRGRPRRSLALHPPQLAARSHHGGLRGDRRVRALRPRSRSLRAAQPRRVAVRLAGRGGRATPRRAHRRARRLRRDRGPRPRARERPLLRLTRRRSPLSVPSNPACASPRRRERPRGSPRRRSRTRAARSARAPARR